MKCLKSLLIVLTLLFIANCSAPIEEISSDRNGVLQYQNWSGGVDESTQISPNLNALMAKNYYIIFDGSGSMSGYIDEARKATIDFVGILPDGANLGLLVFDNSGCSERMSIRELNEKSRKDFIHYVERIPANGGTPLSDAIELSKRALTAQAQKQFGYGEYNIILITDGNANIGYDPTAVVDYINEKTLIIIRTIGFHFGESHSMNRPGDTYYSTANDRESLFAALKGVLAEAPSFDVTGFKEN